MKFSPILLCLAALLMATATKSNADEIDPAGYKIIRHFDKVLSRKGTRDLGRAFVKYGYFSAFAVSSAPGETTYGFKVGASDREFAQKRALAICTRYLKRNRHKGPCKLYAEVIPSNAQKVYTVNGDTLSQWTAKGYARYLADAKNKHKAFVYTRNGGWAYGKSAVSFDDAKRKAMTKCKGYTKRTSELPSEITMCRLAP